MGQRSRHEFVRVLATALVAVVAAMVASLAPAGSVSACSCVGFTDAAAFDQADVVFTGRLVERSVPDGEIVSTTDPALHVFAVDTVLKGEAFAMQSVVSARDGASCGLELPFGADAVIFARTASLDYDLTDGELEANLCGGSRVGPAPDGLGVASAPIPGPTVAEAAVDAAAVPSPTKADTDVNAAPQVGSAIAASEDDRESMVIGVVVVLAAVGLAGFGVLRILMNQRAARRGAGPTRTESG
jgi:hypothetical protein